MPGTILTRSDTNRMNIDAQNLPAPTWPSLLSFSPNGVSVLVVIAGIGAVLYLLGVIRLRRAGRRWPIGRSIAFLLGCALLAATGCLGVHAYAEVLISALLFQQITLMTIVAPLLVLGTPGRLLLRATPHRRIGRTALRLALGGLRSPVSRVLVRPGIAILIAILLYPGLYLTDLVSLLVRVPVGHEVLLLAIFALGVVAAVPLWSSDPVPRPTSFAGRLVEVVVEIQVHAVLGLVMLLSAAPLFSAYDVTRDGWAIDPMRDQIVAGTMMWTYAELPLLIVLIVTLSRWSKRDAKLASRRQTQDEIDLEAYNEYLASLEGGNTKDARRDSGRTDT
ncbi:hypothetical protein GCM10010922_21440 [Microbacterium sorbitolivorans]|uniref:Cytochrome c oxidase assembly protein n=2 Tax=Microbacterium sorbitolivorans TaxID=1867410 RepID=A0A367Y7L2_9MICO|nr:cytochrome c oxidase assembly protein [Microbacterium sorbitolivorans]GGF45419.1 hypothetical protein GCM10010922_21440 [Microbacterium sorbitolivorans]